MATGANRDGGRSPTGLDAMSREILGFEPTYAPAAGPLAVTGGSFARVFRAGEARGPRYFLVERRDGADGLPVPEAATLILYVDEAAVDNRNCLRLLAAVRAAACAGSGTCDEVLTDDTAPDLRDGDGNPTGLVLRAGGDGVTVSYAGNPPLRLESVRLLDPRDSGGTAARVQPLAITVRNLSDAPRGVTLAVAPARRARSAPPRKGRRGWGRFRREAPPPTRAGCSSPAPAPARFPSDGDLRGVRGLGRGGPAARTAWRWPRGASASPATGWPGSPRSTSPLRAGTRGPGTDRRGGPPTSGPWPTPRS